MNVALVGSNFALKGYLPVIKKIRQLKLKILCNRKISKSKKILSKLPGTIHENNWKNIFNNNIDLIILAVPPKVQNQILNYNLKFKKKILFEKPISQNLVSSKKIIQSLKRKKNKVRYKFDFFKSRIISKNKGYDQKQKIR